MACYAVPLAAGLIHGLWRKSAKKTDMHGFWLTLMFLGASVFGLVDHAWHGELFALSSNLMMDLGLGSTITTGIFAAWKFVVYKTKMPSTTVSMSRIIGIHK